MRKVHLTMGLTLGFLFALAGLTGSALVFYVEIDRAIHPALWTAGQEAPPSWESALQTLRRAYPDKAGSWRFEVREDHGPIPARYYNPPETTERDFAPMLVWLSPDGSRVLRRAFWGDTAMTWIYDLHYRLLLGKPGGAVMGWAGLATLFLLLTGVWAWWPRSGGAVKALRMKKSASGIRRLYDLHKTTGLAAVPVLLILVVTGTALGLPRETDAVLSAAFEPPATPHAEAPLWSGARISVDEALQKAHAALPAARLAWIETPASDAGVYRFRLQTAGDPSFRFPHSYVYVNPSTGAVLLTHDVRTFGLSTAIKNWLHPLHDGSAAGLPGRILVFILGFTPAVLLTTGILRWRRRHAGGKAHERR